jgi:hypothetical protein
MLGHKHTGNFTANRGDGYLYTTGNINGRNVITATLPAGHAYGIESAASLADQLKGRFPILWFGPLVELQLAY